MRPYSETQQVENLGEYASASVIKDPPTTPQYTDGTVPRATLPAKWWNWFMGKFSKNTSQTSLAFADIYGELLNLFTRAGITPGVSGSVTPQLHSVLSQLFYANPDISQRLVSTNKTIDHTKGILEKFFVDTAGVVITFADISAAVDPPYKHAEILNISSGNITVAFDESIPVDVVIPPQGLVFVFCVRQSSGVYTWRHSSSSSVTAVADTIVIRDANGRTKMAAPLAEDDVARKAEITAETTAIHKEHISTAGARYGLHSPGSAVAFYQASAPTQRNGVALAAADAGLLWVDSDDKLTKVWDGDSFESLKVALRVSGYVHADLVYGGGVFDALSPAIPNAGDSMLVTGGICNDAGTYLLVFSRAVREDTTTIRVYAASLGAGSSATFRTFSSGSGDFVENISIAW